MAEAGELGHWEIVQKMGTVAGDSAVVELADWAVPIQQRHEQLVKQTSLELAAEEAVAA